MAEEPKVFPTNTYTIGSFSIPVMNIGHLDIPDDKFGCSMIMIGATRSGKTTLLNYIHKKFFSSYISILMSNSLQSDAYKYLKKNCITSDHYHSELLKDQYKINHETNNHYKFLNICDDITDVRNDKELTRLQTIYRNSRMSSIVCAQTATMINTIARSNINFVLIGRCNSAMQYERAVKDFLNPYLPSHLKLVEKITLVKDLTQDHKWILINNLEGKIYLTKLTEAQLIGV